MCGLRRETIRRPGLLSMLPDDPDAAHQRLHGLVLAQFRVVVDEDGYGTATGHGETGAEHGGVGPMFTPSTVNGIPGIPVRVAVVAGTGLSAS